MNISEFMSMTIDDFKKMNTEDRRKVINDVSKYANRNLKYLQKSGITSPSLQVRKDKDTINYFTGDGKNANELMHEFKNLRNFMDNETRTVKGAKAWYSHLTKTLTGNPMAEVTDDEIKEFFSIYSKAKEDKTIASRMSFNYSQHNPLYTATINGKTLVNPLFDAYRELKELYSGYELEEKMLKFIDDYTKSKYEDNLNYLAEPVDFADIIEDPEDDYYDDNEPFSWDDIIPKI